MVILRRLMLHRKGITLVELMMVLAVIGILALSIPNLLTQATRLVVLGRTRLELQREARAAMYIITRQIRQAQSDTIIVDQISGQPYYSRIRFTKAQGQSISIYQSGKVLIFQEGIHISTMTQSLAYMSFSFPRSDDMTIVSVALTLQKLIYGNAIKALHMAAEKVRVMN